MQEKLENTLTYISISLWHLLSLLNNFKYNHLSASKKGVPYQLNICLRKRGPLNVLNESTLFLN